jgi:mannose-6-phosphate isomerase
MTPKDLATKVWPQTERVKAWCGMLDDARTQDEINEASRSLLAAVQGLSRYLEYEPAGLWHEVLCADDRFTTEPCRASSVYHIVCALDTLNHTLA